MDIIIHSFNSVASVMVMIACGFILERKGWISEENTLFISRLVNNVCLPTYMLTNMLSKFNRDQLVSMLSGLAVPFITMVLGIIASKLLAKLIKVPHYHSGIFTVCVSMCNTIFVGLPLCIALFGEECVPYVMLYYMCNTTLFWTFGVQQLATSCSDEKMPLFSKATFSKILSVPMMGYMLGFIMVMLGLNLPGPLFKGLRTIGSMTTPLAMIFIGLSMSKISWKEIHLGLEMVVAMLGRFFICPLIVIAILPFFHLPDLMGKVFVIQAALPSMANIAVIAKKYGGDYKYAALLTAVSCWLAILVIPFYMWLIN